MWTKQGLCRHHLVLFEKCYRNFLTFYQSNNYLIIPHNPKTLLWWCSPSTHSPAASWPGTPRSWCRWAGSGCGCPGAIWRGGRPGAWISEGWARPGCAGLAAAGSQPPGRPYAPGVAWWSGAQEGHPGRSPVGWRPSRSPWPHSWCGGCRWSDGRPPPGGPGDSD